MNALSGPGLSNLPGTAPGERLYAIGDIHGRYDLLKQLIAMIEEHDAALSSRKKAHIVILGDMIDRGPASYDVLRSLHARSRKGAMTVLLGNHEEMMLRAIDGEPGVMKAWLRLGGDATLRSFGVEPPEGEFDLPALTRDIKAAVPERWLEWLRGLPISARSGDYFFCHAGIRPGVDLAKQKRSDLIWIRDEFLASEEAHGVVVVHGHSISPDIELFHNRIGVDTGAYKTGALTAVYLESRQCGFLSTAGYEAEAQDTAPRVGAAARAV